MPSLIPPAPWVNHGSEESSCPQMAQSDVSPIYVMSPRGTIACIEPAEISFHPTPSVRRRRINHSPDFAFVKWGEYQFSFSLKQRCVVAALFAAREEVYRDLRQEYLLELAESDCRRLRDLFRNHPAWGTLIVSAHLSGGPLGAYRLAD